jgi:hypothetical protein
MSDEIYVTLEIPIQQHKVAEYILRIIARSYTLPAAPECNFRPSDRSNITWGGSVMEPLTRSEVNETRPAK